MARHPLTRVEAETLANQYQYLVGSKFNLTTDDLYTIEFVSVAPYDDINQYIVLSQLGQGVSLDKVLEEYSSPLFDVVLIAYLREA